MSDLAKFDKTKQALAQMEDVREVKQVKDMADAATEFYKAQDDFQMSQKAKELSMRSCRRAGQILADVPRNPGTRTDTSCHDVTRYQKILDDSGVGERSAARWQQIARIPEGKFERYFIEDEYYGNEFTIAGLMKYAGEWYQRSDITEWETPQWLFDLLDDEFHFELDVCASSKNAKCLRYFTKEDDAFQQDWRGICWMNPPYGREIKDWMTKASQSVEGGSTVVCFVPARPDTGWWWDNCIAGEIRFIKGRVKFENAGDFAPFPSAIVILRPRKNPKVVWWDVQR